MDDLVPRSRREDDSFNREMLDNGIGKLELGILKY
jgi:hypothetical protein